MPASTSPTHPSRRRSSRSDGPVIAVLTAPRAGAVDGIWDYALGLEASLARSPTVEAALYTVHRPGRFRLVDGRPSASRTDDLPARLTAVSLQYNPFSLGRWA